MIELGKSSKITWFSLKANTAKLLKFQIWDEQLKTYNYLGNVFCTSNPFSPTDVLIIVYFLESIKSSNSKPSELD